MFSGSGVTASFQMPIEHGAWGILLVPYSCAAAVAARWNTPLALTGMCALSLFLLRGSLEAQVAHAQPSQIGKARWSHLLAPSHLLLAAAAGTSGFLLIFFYRRGELVWIGLVAAALYLLQRRLAHLHEQYPKEKRSLPAELAGAVLLTLTAPAAWIAARGSLFEHPPGRVAGDGTGVKVWLLNLLFFFGGVLYVKYRVRGLLVHRSFATVGERLLFAWPVFLYHFLLAAFLVCWTLLDALSAAVIVAFAPGILRAAGLLLHLGQRFPIRRLGWSEILHAAAFAGLLILAFRLSG